MKLKKKKVAVFACTVTLAWILGTGSVFAADLPRAQLDESERHFTEAYGRFLERDYWGAMNYLNRALRVNTYLVDYYLLQGLVAGRAGDYASGREALSYYLEVRPMDSTAPRILSYAISQQRDMARILGTSPLSARWQISYPDVQTEFQLGIMRPFHVKGLSKADAWGSVLCLADTLGNRVYLRKESMKGVAQVALDAPVATMPLGDESFYAVTAGGSVYSFNLFQDDPALVSPDLRGTIDSNPADAALLSSTEFAVADPVLREVGFHSFVTFEKTDSWAPANEEMLFEPVAVSAYGPWIAAADRGNGKIFFLNAANRRDSFYAEVPRPRDVAWSSIGELFAVNDDGDIFKVTVNFRDRRAESVDLMEQGVINGWTLFNSSEGDIMYCLDIGASRLWKAVSLPSPSMASGYLSVANPAVEYDEGSESFLLEASLMSPFVTYSKRTNPVVYCVWNNRTISSVAAWQERPDREAGVIVFHRAAPLGTVNPALNAQVVESGMDVRIALPSIWSAERNTLTNIVLDSSIPFGEDDFSQNELEVLTFFCLYNGVELDIWARTVPSVELVRASALTGGKTVYSLVNVPDLPPPYNRMQIRIPLPQELSSSGYPSRSMLTVYLDVGQMYTRDWIPLWPDMLE